MPLFLGIAYASSIGGLGTPIGSPPNVIFLKIYAQATGNTPSFAQWMLWAVPVVVLLIPLAGLWITRNFGASAPFNIPQVGLWRSEERRVLIIFSLTAPRLDYPARALWWVVWLAGGAFGKLRGSCPDSGGADVCNSQWQWR